MSPTDRPAPAPPFEVAGPLRPLCARFAADWQAGRRPRLEDFLSQVEEQERSALLRALLALELEHRTRGGEAPSAEEYHLRLPGHNAVIENALAVRTVGPETLASPAPAAPEEESTLRRAGRFEVQAEIARGGMGAVWLARDPELNRPLAVKVLRPEYRDRPELERRFREEAQVTGQLQHPGIPPVHEVGTLADGRPFFAMKLIKGRTLAELLQQRPSAAADLPRFLSIFKQVCQTLAYAHSKGVIHRDLKPSNIMVGAFGEVQVMDWGLAKVLGKAAESRECSAGEEPSTIATVRTLSPGLSSHAGAVLGTPAYMAPEQARGEVDRLDERCDVFGLGAILCVILTDAPPFRQRALDQGARRDLTDAVARLDRCGADEELVKLAKACLAPHTEDRPRNASEVAESVARYQAGVEERRRAAELDRARAEARVVAEQRARQEAEARAAAERDSRAEAVAREKAQRRAKRWMAAAAAMVSVLALGVGGFFWQRGQRDRDLRKRADDLLREGETSLPARPAHARDRAREVLTLVGERASFPDVSLRADRLARRAEEVVGHQEEVKTVPPAFLQELKEAEFHILGSLWTLLPHEDLAGKRRIRRGAKTGARLTTGIDILEKSLRRYQLPANPGVFQELPERGYDEPLVAQLRMGAADGLFLLALAVERTHQGGDANKLKDARARSVALLDLSEQLGNRTKSLYQARAKFVGALGRKAAAARDRTRADRLAPVTFLDHHFLAGEAHRAGDLPEAAQGYQAALALRPKDYWTLFRLAKVKESQGQPNQAVGLYQSCVSLRPNDPTAINNRGELLHRLGRWKDAVADLRHAVELDPEYLSAVHNLMLALAELKDVEAAGKVRDAYRKGRKPTPPEEAELLCDLGIAHERAGKLEDALNCYAEARGQDADYVPALRNRGNLLIRLRRFAEAGEDLNKAVTLEPKDGGLLYILGNLHAEAGRGLNAPERIETAIRSYDKALEVAPGMANAAYNRGVLLRQVKRYKDALASQNRVLSLRASEKLTALALHERALNLASLRDFRAALKDLNRLLTMNPVNVPGLLTRGRVLADLGNDLEGSEQDLSLAVRLSPKLPDGYRARGLTRFRAEKWRGAVEDYRRYLQLLPEAPDAEAIHNDISTSLLHLGRLEEAEAEFRLIPKVSSPSTLSNLGNLALKKANLECAITDFGAAIRLDPGHTRAWALRGQARLRQGRFEEAATALDKALELQPGMYETLLFSGLAHYHRKDVLAARAKLKPVANDRPQHVRGRMAQGLLSMLDQEYVKAVTDLSPAVDDPILGPFAVGLRARCWLLIGCPGLKLAESDGETYVKSLPRDGFAHLEAARILLAVTRGMDRRAAERLHDRGLDLLELACKYQPDLRKNLAEDELLKDLRGKLRFKKLTESNK
jgi:serine/threonine-protein kinase